MSNAELTGEQRQTIQELQRELATLDLKADIEWAKYIHTQDVDCFNEVLALESEREMLGLIAYVPKAGELKVSKVRGLITKIKATAASSPVFSPILGEWEARLVALDRVNEWRAEYELPPLDRLPKGVPGDSSECTIARAFVMSLEEMGVKPDQVDVRGGDDIDIRWEDASGVYHDEHPMLGNEGDKVISGFDENAWLDLLTDDSLEQYADTLSVDPEDLRGSSDEDHLEEISAELARRGRRHLIDSGGVDIELGRDADPVRVQIAALS